MGNRLIGSMSQEDELGQEDLQNVPLVDLLQELVRRQKLATPQAKISHGQVWDDSGAEMSAVFVVRGAEAVRLHQHIVQVTLAGLPATRPASRRLCWN